MRRAAAVALVALAAACSQKESPPRPADPATVGLQKFAQPAASERPKAREPQTPLEMLRAGAVALRGGDYATARRLWKECVTQAQPGDPAQLECAHGLITPEFRRLASSATVDDEDAQWVYAAGVYQYQRGNYAKARANWEKCAEVAVPGGQAEASCWIGLAHLNQMYGKRRGGASTAPDGKK
jgi:tetratricopeptide (TPR) repeat protein